MTQNSPDKLSKKEIERRRDEALKRALNTPPRPHTPKGKPKKRRQSAEKAAHKL
jgi:hypothetical protein